MSERLRPRDVALLAEESPSAPMHNATVEIFDPGQSGFDYPELVRLVQERLSFVPRYRQRVQTVPGHLANPVWVDDAHFDLGYHVRRSALPRPGTLDQLRGKSRSHLAVTLERPLAGAQIPGLTSVSEDGARMTATLDPAKVDEALAEKARLPIERMVSIG